MKSNSGPGRPGLSQPLPTSPVGCHGPGPRPSEDYTCSNLASSGKGMHIRDEQGEELWSPTWLKDKEVTSVRSGVHGTRPTQAR